CPLVLDADGLNICAILGTNANLQQRPAPTVITPHLGEFRTLFPDLADKEREKPSGSLRDRLELARKAVEVSGAVLLFKGARAIVASPSNSRGETIPKIWINPESTPALARGGSGDVLTGLTGGLLAGCRRFGDGLAGPASVGEVVKTAVWWHARAAILATEERTELGVDAFTLTEYLMRVLALQRGKRSPQDPLVGVGYRSR
ncbi:MAG: NAD(P)H-hydrate dehydratase, partial [Okeania sp. SIO2H7]|nr:NAD(P)H-hydrate dehydratase [Okeania sp. SIO2H7]